MDESSPIAAFMVVEGPEVTEESRKMAPAASNRPPKPKLRFLLNAKLRTEQLRWLNLQRCKGLRHLRDSNMDALREGADRSELPEPPELRGRSICVPDLYFMFDESTHCKWCHDELTAETLALTFDLPIDQGGDPNIENVVAICKQCFFLKGFYPQAFWARLVDWLRHEDLLDVFRRCTATWSRKTAFNRRRRRRG